MEVNSLEFTDIICVTILLCFPSACKKEFQWYWNENCIITGADPKNQVNTTLSLVAMFDNGCLLTEIVEYYTKSCSNVW